MKRITFIMVNGNKATYNKSDVENLEYLYETFENSIMKNATAFEIKTDDNKYRSLIMLNNLIGVDVEY